MLGFLPYWLASNVSIGLGNFTDIAVFSAEITAEGTIPASNASAMHDLADLVRGECPSCRVWLTVTAFSEPLIDEVLANHVREAISSIVNAAEHVGADGVIIDWEFIPEVNNLTGEPNRAYLVELLAGIKAAGLMTSVCVSGDVEAVWRDPSLNEVVDLVFLMGYDYHWSGSEETGPVSPIDAPYLDIADSLEILSAYYPKEKIVLGLPLYGYDWPAASCEPYARTLGEGSYVPYSEIVQNLTRYGVRWDPLGHSPWIAYRAGSACRQVWFENMTSLAARIDYALRKGYGGVGFWALGYEGEEGAADLAKLLTSRREPPAIRAIGVRVVEGGGEDEVEVWVEGASCVNTVKVVLEAPSNTSLSIGYVEGVSVSAEASGPAVEVTLSWGTPLGDCFAGSSLVAVLWVRPSGALAVAGVWAGAYRLSPNASTYTAPASVSGVEYSIIAPPHPYPSEWGAPPVTRQRRGPAPVAIL